MKINFWRISSGKFPYFTCYVCELNEMTLMQRWQSWIPCQLVSLSTFAFMNSQIISVATVTEAAKGADTTKFPIHSIYNSFQWVFFIMGMRIAIAMKYHLFIVRKVQCNEGKLHVVSDTINYKNGEKILWNDVWIRYLMQSYKFFEPLQSSASILKNVFAQWNDLFGCWIKWKIPNPWNLLKQCHEVNM